MIYVSLPNDEQRKLPFYLAVEEYVARELPAGDYFFMWQVLPTVIFGRNQLIEAEVDIDYCRANGIATYRRKSGGGCVYADLDNIMFSYITPDSNVNFTFNRYMLMIEHVLQKLGLDARTTGRNDILIDGKKVSGNAFYHLPNRSIVHGTMLYNTDLEKMVRSTTPSDEKLKSKGVESVRQHVTTLNRYLTISIEEFKEFVRENLCDSEIRLDEDAVRQIEKIESEYLTEEFIYGRNPAYTLVRRARIEGVGEFELRLEIKKGLIRKVNMLGDFFLVGDLDGGLLARLQGVPFEKKAVEEALLDVEPSAIIMNMTKEQLIELINKIF
ncbi:MAG: lipoate--protein ligase [Bacteroidaceae bacterium]|nr:lipoate--protein ligase [Bacteroidaceae bacterium]